MKIALVIAAWGLVVLGSFVFFQRWATRRRAWERVFEASGKEAPPTEAPEASELGLLSRWLYLAGYRSRAAGIAFVGLSLVAICIGLLGVYLLFALGPIDKGLRLSAALPGAAGELLASVFYAIPWLLFALLAITPWLVVRDARQRRVLQVEQDLPLFLELLATLSEAGLGFDAALARILDAQPAGRVLIDEFRTFQIEVLAGRARVQCLRRLSRRVEVTSLTVLISALVQAEQVGSGIADVLRRQSDDLRDRRRERAIALASTLPVKLLFPLVICFLPGIFVITLGPVFHRLFQSVDTMFRVPGSP